jgi:hypothetical protein
VTKKAARLLLIVAVVLLALIAAAAWFINLYRDAIALEVARSALGDSGVVVTDVSVGSISSSEVIFDTIVVELEGGATLLVEGITLPVRLRGLTDSRLHIDSVRFVPTDEDPGPVALAAALQAFLDAPDATPGATIAIDRVSVPALPAIEDFAWHADRANPTLQATIAGFELFITTTELEDGVHRGTIRALLGDDTEVLLVALVLTPEDPGFRVEGSLNALLQPFLPALHAVGTVPSEVTDLTASIDGTFDFRLDGDAALPVDIRGTFAAAPAATASYRGAESTLELSLIESGPANVTLQYPSLDWSLKVARSSLMIDGAGLDLPPIRLQDSECRAGVRCRTAIELAFDKREFGDFSVARVTASAPTVEFVSDDDAWQVSARNARLVLKEPAWGGRRFVAPAISADVTATADRVSGNARIGTPEGGLAGTVDLSHDLASGRGTSTLRSASIDFGKLSLADLFRDWSYDWNVEAGRAEATAVMRWQQNGSAFEYSGTAAASAGGLAGRYADIGFVGLDSQLDVRLDAAAPIALEPFPFNVALVDIGFPLEDISGTAAPDIDAAAVAVSDLSMSVLGGTVTADPFRFELDADSNRVLLRASGVQLPLMAGLADLEAITISGSVSGEIPVTIRGNKVIIDGGRLENDPPGGVIRYRGGGAEGIAQEGSQLGIVTRTLQNFEFDSLTSAVNYSDDGDLVLKMRLKGINPDVDPTQPVILNLNVENNVPQMLRSLQATRSIEDVLEKRIAK